MCCRAALLVTGGMCAGLGIAVLLALSSGHITVAQVASTSVPMPPLSALGFLLCGAGLLALGMWYPSLAFGLAIMAVSLGLVGATQGFWGGNPRIGGILSFSTGFQMAPNTALVFVLAGIAGLLRLGRMRLPCRYLLIAASGSLILAAGLVAYLGYVVRVPLYCWNTDRPMSFLCALGAALLGLGVIVSAWRYSEIEESGAPRWIGVIGWTGALAAAGSIGLSMAGGAISMTGYSLWGRVVLVLVLHSLLSGVACELLVRRGRTCGPSALR